MERSVYTSPQLALSALLRLPEVQAKLETIALCLDAGGASTVRASIPYAPAMWKEAGEITDQSVPEAERYLISILEEELRQLPPGTHTVSVQFRANKTVLRTRAYQVVVQAMPGFDDGEFPLPNTTTAMPAPSKLAELDALMAMPGLQAMVAFFQRMMVFVEQTLHQQSRVIQMQQGINDRQQAALMASYTKQLDMYELAMAAATHQQGAGGPSKEVVDAGREIWADFSQMMGLARLPPGLRTVLKDKMSDPEVIKKLDNPEYVKGLQAMLEGL